MHICLIAAILILYFELTNGVTFVCYHGEDSAKTYVRLVCPSKICIIFNSTCGYYTSTTCYNPQNPMKVINTFKIASFYYANSPQSTSFRYCTISECNKEMGSLKNPTLINFDPISFDSLLSKSVKQEELKKKLQNGIKISTGIDKNETFKFVGQTFKTSKSPWIAFSCTYKNGSSMRFQINFDLKQSKLISKSFKLVNANQKVKKLNQTWTNPTKPGSRITILLRNKNPVFLLTVNGVKVPKFLDDGKIKAVNLITFGGGWKMSGASITDTKGKTTKLKMFPTFYSDLIPLNFAKLKGNLESKELNAQNFTVEKEEREHLLNLDSIDVNRMTNYEFRISPNPQSDLIKLQFQHMPAPPANEQYVILWKRIKSIWTSAGTVFLNQGIKCNNHYSIGIAENGLNFYCGNKNVHNISYPKFKSLVQYKIQTFWRFWPLTCPEKDPYKDRFSHFRGKK